MRLAGLGWSLLVCGCCATTSPGVRSGKRIDPLHCRLSAARAFLADYWGLLWVIYGGQYMAGPIYDALLHTIFWVLSFHDFCHAPVIVPAVLGTQIPYAPVLCPLALLHLRY